MNALFEQAQQEMAENGQFSATPLKLRKVRGVGGFPAGFERIGQVRRDRETEFDFPTLRDEPSTLVLHRGGGGGEDDAPENQHDLTVLVAANKHVQLADIDLVTDRNVLNKLALFFSNGLDDEYAFNIIRRGTGTAFLARRTRFEAAAGYGPAFERVMTAEHDDVSCYRVARFHWGEQQVLMKFEVDAVDGEGNDVELKSKSQATFQQQAYRNERAKFFSKTWMQMFLGNARRLEIGLLHGGVINSVETYVFNDDDDLVSDTGEVVVCGRDLDNCLKEVHGLLQLLLRLVLANELVLRVTLKRNELTVKRDNDDAARYALDEAWWNTIAVEGGE